ncbi:Lrp/AsnC family transcriptional regulator [Algivirga pacifica]|uniref:Lrp/AsnC family transcriptional regulator n=1 Tax=Algivirga pacifica TaxID=1162670 RepID=A0ABP9DK77_9BACT
MDEIDKKILTALQQDARTTHKELSAIAGISTTPVYERVKRLEREGVIKRYVALLDKKKVGKALTVISMVTLKSHKKDVIDKFHEHVLAMPEVMECYHMAGNYDYMLKVLVNDMEEYQKLLVEDLARTEAIANIQSMFVMGEVKQETAYNL